MFNKGQRVISQDGSKTGTVTWIGQDYPTGHRTKVKWDGGGTTLTFTDTLTEVPQ